MDEARIVDSATQLDQSARGAVCVCGSHGGVYPAWLAAKAGVRAVILNDAGIGRHSAGVAGIAWIGGLGIAACAIDHRSARIADGADMLANGVISTVNEVGARHGCLPGHTCAQALECLLDHEEEEAESAVEVPGIGETRARIGDGRSTYETGILSHINDVARRLELREGMSAREAVARLVGLG